MTMPINDVFKQSYTELLPEVKDHISIAKRMAQELWDHIDLPLSNRELQLGKTNLEQAIMWYVKGMANYSDLGRAAKKDATVNAE